MEDDTLVILKGETIRLVRECRDTDLIDLVYKLLASQCEAEHSINSQVYQGL